MYSHITVGPQICHGKPFIASEAIEHTEINIVSLSNKE